MTWHRCARGQLAVLTGGRVGREPVRPSDKPGVPDVASRESARVRGVSKVSDSSSVAACKVRFRVGGTSRAPRRGRPRFFPARRYTSCKRRACRPTTRTSREGLCALVRYSSMSIHSVPWHNGAIRSPHLRGLPEKFQVAILPVFECDHVPSEWLASNADPRKRVAAAWNSSVPSPPRRRSEARGYTRLVTQSSTAVDDGVGRQAGEPICHGIPPLESLSESCRPTNASASASGSSR